MTQIDLVLTNTAGLHARPAARFIQKASSYTSKVTIRTGEKTADAKSILSLMGLGLGQGTRFTLMVDGADEVECIAALKAMVENNFGEV